ncbi:bifunctional phosphopantothenoylcysteine decarboxylase/phosphopantothenate--cysteine ligase CoaBC [Hippea jasoniae]|uniref:bifunctional phosphopantothenoylcysteine decarboxylase/phosphopantothenate--cysteine ligase CoaBC n=1 Tax=Hippea jasoniae TaxID=944479 RepID=UPI0005533ECC|nr:bifunctional phosphopantothenoylcysteine decarboxylase/phosphopantothenate--cysteine ligase CoaBC [Hippea jasoniae]
MVKKANVLIGVTASIAIYKALEVISILKKRGFSVRVVLSREAKEFISPVVFEAITNQKVYSDVLEEIDFEKTNITHVALAEWADVFAVVPATANIISKLACGIADDPVSLIGLATKATKIIAPAMNSSMYLNPIIQENIAKLKGHGFVFVGPKEGMLACNTEGIGHIADCEDIADAIESALYLKQLAGRHVIVTAGPTIEPVDPVRYLTNHSSGKMGFALAKIAYFMGADVHLISGPVCLKTPFGVKRIDVSTTQEMLDAIKTTIDGLDGEIILVMAAAIADFKPANYAQTKIKRSDREKIQIELTSNPDVTASVRDYAFEKSKHLRIVGFAAETDNIIENAKQKIAKKGLEFIVANDVKRDDIAFGSDFNEAMIIYPDGRSELLKKDKKEVIAFEILRRVV